MRDVGSRQAWQRPTPSHSVQSEEQAEEQGRRHTRTQAVTTNTSRRPGVGSYVCSVGRRRPGSSFGHSAARTDPAGRRGATGTAGTARDLRTARSDRRNLADRSIDEILRLHMNVQTGLLPCQEDEVTENCLKMWTRPKTLSSPRIRHMDDGWMMDG